MALARTLRAETASRKVRVGILSGESPRNAAGRRVLGEKREAALARAVRNYDRRTRAKIKKYYGEVTVETVAKYARMMGEETVIINLDRAQIKSVRSYNLVMAYLNRDKTKAFKRKLTNDRQEWLIKTLENGYDLDEEHFPELFRAVRRMSADRIMSWATGNPGFVKKLYYHYEDVWDSESAGEWKALVNELIDTLQPYSGEQIPKVE